MSQFVFQKDVEKIEGLILIMPTVHRDSRGYFMETYNNLEFSDNGFNISFVQDNQSLSSKGVLRGMHFQKNHAQGKLVRAISGAIYDVAVDLRSSSKTFGKWYGKVLSADNALQLYVPPGFAQGFLALENNTLFSAKVTDYQYKQEDCGLIWNDKDIGIDWSPYLPENSRIIISDNDKSRKTLSSLIKDGELPNI